jgi:hypothetical protein
MEIVYLLKYKIYDNANEKRANENALTNRNNKSERENRFANRERRNQEADVDSDSTVSTDGSDIEMEDNSDKEEIRFLAMTATALLTHAIHNDVAMNKLITALLVTIRS